MSTSSFCEFTAFAEPGDDHIHAELLDEDLEIITRLWTGDVVTYRGRHHIRRRRAVPPAPAPAATHPDLVRRALAPPPAPPPIDVAIPSWTASAPPAAYEPAGATWWSEAFQPDTPLEMAHNVVQGARSIIERLTQPPRAFWAEPIAAAGGCSRRRSRPRRPATEDYGRKPR